MREITWGFIVAILVYVIGALVNKFVITGHDYVVGVLTAAIATSVICNAGR